MVIHRFAPYNLMKEGGGEMPNNEKRIINTVDLEAVAGGGIPLPGVTIPTCPNCGSNESNTEFYNNNGKYYRRFVCLKCGAYFCEEEMMIPPGQVQRPW